MSHSAKTISALSAVMPAYNEEDVLPLSLGEAVTALEKQCERWELVVVDDGSTDRTPEILADWAEREPRVRVVTNRPNQGYSRALIRGFRETRLDPVFYTDGDAQFDLLEIGRLYPLLEQADMVAGYRVGRQDPWQRLLTSWIYNRIQGLVLGIKVRDVNCAFKLFRQSFFDRVSLSSDGFLIDAELFVRARAAHLNWVQAGVRHRPRERGSSTVRAGTVAETLAELWRLRQSVARGT